MDSVTRMPRWRREGVVLGVFAFLCAAAPVVTEAQKASRAKIQPNVLVIVLDDVGTDKLRIYGESESPVYASAPYCGAILDPLPYPRTPTIEALAEGRLPGMLGGGVRFDQAYAAPICCPARACLQTGRYGFRNGLGVVDDGGVYRERMSNSELLLPELLRRGFPPPTPGSLKRYRSGAFGKWHLSALPVCDPVLASDFAHPVLNGFHLFQGAMGNLGTNGSNPGDHFNWTKVTSVAGSTDLTRYEVGSQNQTGPFQFSAACTVPGVRIESTSYSEDNFSASVTRRDAVAWINAQTQPFFAYVNFNAPHFPYQVPPFSLLSTATQSELGNPGNCGGPYCAGQRAGFAGTCGTSTCGDPTGCTITQQHVFYNAMLEAVDTEIGNLLAQMDAVKRANTMVFVLADNGTPSDIVESTLHDPAHGKGTLYQLGARVPFIAAGPLVAPGAHQTGALVHAVDLWRTVADITGANEALATAPTLDSISFKNQLVNPGAPSARSEVFCQGFARPGSYQPTDLGPYESACQDPHVPGVYVWAPQDLVSHGRSLFDGQYKLIVLQTVGGIDGAPPGSPDTAPEYVEELYDLTVDPEETNDLIPLIPGDPVITAARDQLRARLTLLSGY